MTAEPDVALARPAPPGAGSQREAYRQALVELALADERIWCLDSDMGGLRASFARAVPARYVDVGIAEANLVSVAAALAASGAIPFVNTMASFAAARACEQLKIDVAYNRVPVKVVATHGGVSGGHFGPTHHALEDLAIVRALANMTVLVPADAIETALAVEAAVAVDGPVYIRLGRQRTPAVHAAAADCDFVVGRAARLRDGDDVTLVACGPYGVNIALEAHARLAEAGVAARVENMSTLKPLDTDAVVAAAQQTRGIVTVEEHSVIGGLGGAVAETLAETHPAMLRRIGARDVFCDEVGPPEHLLAHLGITADAVTLAALELLVTT